MKDLEQNFSDFRGLDVRSSDLTRPKNAAKEISNFTIEKNFTLGGVKGLKTTIADMPGEPVLGFHNYIYRDPDTGETKEELLALSQYLYRMKEGTFSISYSGSGTYYQVHTYFTTTGGPSDNTTGLQIDIYDEATQVLDYNVETGLEDDTASPIDLATLKAAIDALTDFSATITGPPTTSVATIIPLTYQTSVAAASSLDLTVRYWEKVNSFIPSSASAGIGPAHALFTQHQDANIPLPVFLNKDNVCYIALGRTMPLMKYDGMNFYQAGVPEIIPEDFEMDSVTTTPNLNGTFRWYARVARRDYRGNFVYGRGAYSDVTTVASGDAPRVNLFGNSSTSKGLENDTLVARRTNLAGILIGTETPGSTEARTSFTLSSIDESGLPYYGFDKLRVGDLLYISNVTNGSHYAAETSTHCRLVSIDRETKVITIDQSVNVTASSALNVYRSYMEFGSKFCQFSATQSNVSTFSVSSVSYINIGDVLYFTNEDQWLEITDISGLNVTVDGVVSTTTNDVASDTIVELFRTEDGGYDKLYVSKRIAIQAAAYGTFNDTLADASLGEELSVPLNEPDHLKERPSVIANHQGVLVASGGALRAGRLFIENYQYLEGFPQATNFYDVPSQDAGTITALWSDSFDQLAVFKESAYYSVIGDFRSDIIRLVTDANTEGDYGVSSQNSLMKIRGLNIGVGKLGFVVFKNGEINYEASKQLDSEFLVGNVGDTLTSSEVFQIQRCTSVNDKLKQQAIFFVPALNFSGTDHLGANENSKIYILDYSESAWLRRAFPSDLSAGSSGLLAFPFFPTAGMVVFEDRLWFACAAYDSTLGSADHTDFTSHFFRRKEKESLGPSVSDYRYDYADQHAAIEYDLQEQWRFGDTPSLNNIFEWLKIYMFPTTDFVPFTLRIRTYINWDTDNAIDDISLTVTSTTKKMLVKLKATQAECMMVRFTVNTLHQKPTITGYEFIMQDTDPDGEGLK